MKTRIIGAIVALVLAAVGAFVLITYVRGADARAAEGAELVDAYIVEKAVPEGTLGEAIGEFVRVDQVPERTLAGGNVTDLSELAGLVADADILAGEQLLSGRFIDPAALAARGDVPVPAGMQVISFVLPAERVVGGAVRAGDEIGMVATFARPGGDLLTGEPVLKPQSQFAFHDVLVTKVQGVVVPSEDGEAEQAPGSQLMLTIALGTHDIERWVWAAEGNASIWLTLENEATDNGGSSRVEEGNFVG